MAQFDNNAALRRGLAAFLAENATNGGFSAFERGPDDLPVINFTVPVQYEVYAASMALDAAPANYRNKL